MHNYPNFKIRIFLTFSGAYAGCRDNNHVQKDVYVGFNAESRVFKAYTTIIYSNSRMYAGFLKETHVHIKKLIFGVFLGIFRLWCLLENFS